MWLQQTSVRERRTLFAGFLGYGVDGFDFMIYTCVIPTLILEWNMTRAEAVYIATGALLILAYTRLAVTDGEMLFLGFSLGFFLSGIFSGMGAFLAELYPNTVRGSGQGFCYNFGRAVGAVCPALIGAWSTHGSLALALAISGTTVAAYALVIAAAWALPETCGRALVADPA